MFDRIEFMISEAFVALRRNGLMTFAAVTTVAVSLFLIGGLGYVYLRIQDYATTIPNRFEMRVFLKDEVKGEGPVSVVAGKIRAIQGVSRVAWIPRDKSWALYQKEHPDLAEGIDNPYPECIKVQVGDLSLADTIADQIRSLPQVNPNPKEGVVYLKAEQHFLENVLTFIRWLGLVFGGLLFLTGGILIYNAIHLTVLSRRLEIRIMRLVGASQLTIRIPFLIEGLVQGALGGIIASLMISATNNLVLNFIHQHAPEAVFPLFPLRITLLLLGGIGALYGLLCSMFAVRVPLRGQ